MPYPKKYRLSKMRYDEVSLVDSGANQHAHVLIYKRDVPIEKAVDRRLQQNSKLSTPSSGGGSGGGSSSRGGANWNESHHSRGQKGTPAGGQFVTTSGTSASTGGKKVAATKSSVSDTAAKKAAAAAKKAASQRAAAQRHADAQKRSMASHQRAIAAHKRALAAHQRALARHAAAAKRKAARAGKHKVGRGRGKGFKYVANGNSGLYRIAATTLHKRDGESSGTWLLPTTGTWILTKSLLTPADVHNNGPVEVWSGKPKVQPNYQPKVKKKPHHSQTQTRHYSGKWIPKGPHVKGTAPMTPVFK